VTRIVTDSAARADNVAHMSPRKTLAPTLNKNTKASRESLCGVWLQPFKELTRLTNGQKFCEVTRMLHQFINSMQKTYFPIQKLEKILPNKSSEENSPVMSLNASCASRKSSASNSPAW